MWSQFKQILSPPVFPDDPDKTAVAKILNDISLFFIAVLIIVIPLITIVSGGLVRTLIWTVPTFLTLVGIKILIAKGYLNPASIVLIVVLWLITLFTTATAGGVQAPGYSTFVILVFLAGILLSWRFALGVAFFTGSLGLLFLWLDSQGRLPYSPLPENDFRIWLFHTITVVVVVLLMWVGLGSIREALANAQYELYQRQLSEERFAKIFKTSPNAQVITELESGIVLDANKSFELLFGFSKEMVVGRTATSVNAYSNKEGRQIWVDMLREQGFVHELEMPLRRNSGEIRTCLLSIEAIELDGKACAISFVQDITDRKQAEIEILQSQDELSRKEAQLRTVVDNMPFWVWLKDVNGRFLVVNDLFIKQRAEVAHLRQVIGKTDYDFPGSMEHADIYLEEEQRVMESRIPMSREMTVELDDKKRIFEAYKAPFLDNDNRVLGTFGFSRDITMRKQAENTLLESETRFRGVFEDAGIGMVLVSPDHDIVKANRAFAEMLGYSEEELIGTLFKDITYPEDVDVSIENHKHLIQGKINSYQFEKRYLHKQGHIVWALLHVSLIHTADKEPSYAIAQVQGIDDRKQMEADRELLILELERRNAELERFAYTVSHDLKSPLVTIGGFLGYLERDAENGNMAQLRMDIGSIRNAADKMRLLLDELLELSRVGRLMNPPEEISYAEIVKDAIAATEGQLMMGEVALVVSDEFPMVVGDRLRLVEVVQNLIDNAIKFSKGQPQSVIEIGVRHGGDEPIFFVKDNGIGILPQHHEKIFDIFNKLNPDVEGTGIGLALVKRIIEVHNGRLWVESDGMGNGSTFCFTLNEMSLLTA